MKDIMEEHDPRPIEDCLASSFHPILVVCTDTREQLCLTEIETILSNFGRSKGVIVGQVCPNLDAE
jgi:hypothetical protein